MEKIRHLGHEVPFNWPVLPMVKPYCKNSVKAGDFTESSIQGIIDANVYVLFAHEDGTGVFAELGAALAIAQLHGKLKIYAVAETITPAMFHYHPLITWVKSLDEVLAEYS